MSESEEEAACLTRGDFVADWEAGGDPLTQQAGIHACRRIMNAMESRTRGFRDWQRQHLELGSF